MRYLILFMLVFGGWGSGRVLKQRQGFGAGCQGFGFTGSKIWTAGTGLNLVCTELMLTCFKVEGQGPVAWKLGLKHMNVVCL